MPTSYSPETAGPRLTRIGLTDQVHRILRRQVLDGKYPGGSTLNTVELATELGISRTPVRQALQIMEQQGLVEVDTRGQYVVRQPTTQEILEVFLLRVTLEWMALRMVVERADDASIRALRRVLDEQETAMVDGDGAKFLDLDGHLHVQIARCAGLQHTAQFLTELRDQIVLLGGKAITQPGRREAVLAEHHVILNAVAERNAEKAVEALANHLLNTARSLSEEIVGPLEVLVNVSYGKGDLGADHPARSS